MFVPTGTSQEALIREINELTKSLGQALSSGRDFAARMIELDLFGLVEKLVARVGRDKAQLLMYG